MYVPIKLQIEDLNPSRVSGDLCVHQEFKIREGADFLESSYEKGVYVITEFTILYCNC